MENWRTAITDVDGNRIIVRGHDLVSLMQHGTYADVVALLLGGHKPDEGERRLIEAMLIGISDHGAGAPSAATARMAATGNRQAPEAAVAAGILAIGDAHAGAGMACMVIIAGALDARGPGVAFARRHRAGDGTRRAERQAAACRVLVTACYSEDPRTTVLFAIAEQYGKAGPGVAFMRALESAVAETDQAAADQRRRRDRGRALTISAIRRSREADLHRRPDGRAGGARHGGVHAASARCASAFPSSTTARRRSNEQVEEVNR